MRLRSQSANEKAQREQDKAQEAAPVSPPIAVVYKFRISRGIDSSPIRRRSSSIPAQPEIELNESLEVARNSFGMRSGRDF